jgi:hypothetical protein
MSSSDGDKYILEYEVVKDHHRMGWLSQARKLRITDTAVENCKPSSSGDSSSPAGTTKRLLFTAISRVAVNGTTKFCIRVDNDHIYFYTANNALEIALEIQKRVTAAKTIVDIANGSADDALMLMRSFCRGELQLPQYSDDNARKRGMSRILLSQASASMPSRSAVTTSTATAQSSSSEKNLLDAAEEQVYLSTLSLRLEIFKAFREGFFGDAASRARKLLSEYEREDAAFVSLGSLRADMDTLKESLSELITSTRSTKRFVGLSAEMDEDNEFVSRIADDIIQDEVVKPMGDFLWQSLLLQSDLVGLQHQYDRQIAVIASRELSEFGIAESMMAMHFGLVTKGMRQITETVTTPTKHMDHLVHVAKSIVLTIEANSRLETEKKRRRQHQQDDVAPNVVSLGPNETKNAIEHIPSQHRAAPETRTMLSADDILPLYIFLLAKAGVPNVVFLREWVTKLGDQTECSERSYYVTMFCSAAEYILNGDPSNVTLAKSPEASKRHLHRVLPTSTCSSVSIELDPLQGENVCSSSASEIEV